MLTQNINHQDDFQLDHRLQSSCFQLIDWPLCRVLLKNNADYPWFILVPRRQNLVEITDFSQSDQHQLMDEVHLLSRIIQEFFQPNKINLASLGNIVSQFHLHVVARFHHDALWPQGIWQSTTAETPYLNPDALIRRLIVYLQLNKVGVCETSSV
jgi:diadenosine tetraphosphate (Ap4A) HIT family hydrolase